MNLKRIILKDGAILAFGVGMYFIGNNYGYNTGYANGLNDGVETTKQEIRRSVVDLKDKIERKEKDARNTSWNSTNTLKYYTYGDINYFEANAFSDCHYEISKILDYDIDRLTVEDVKERIEWDKIYNK